MLEVLDFPTLYPHADTQAALCAKLSDAATEFVIAEAAGDCLVPFSCQVYRRSLVASSDGYGRTIVFQRIDQDKAYVWTCRIEDQGSPRLAQWDYKEVPLGGGSIHWVASLSVEELNSLATPEPDGLYGVTDAGSLINKDGSQIAVNANDVVIWANGRWDHFVAIDLSDYVKKAELEAHTGDMGNPHHVTAAQVGAYTKEEVDAEIKKESDARELYDTQLRESIEALEEKTGDFVTGEEVSAAISAEADARIQEDIAINARIDMIPQTDWNEEDEGSMAYLANHPQPISDLDIEALFS